MIRNIYAFDQFMRNIVPEVEGQIGKMRRWIAVEIWSQVTRMSPVDTGRFRASWNISEGSPDMSTQPEGNHGPPSRSHVSDRPFEKTFVSNGLPYGERLEFGWSRQAPQGMVRITIAEMETTLIMLGDISNRDFRL